MHRKFKLELDYYLNSPDPETLEPASENTDQSPSPSLDDFANKESQ